MRGFLVVALLAVALPARAEEEQLRAGLQAGYAISQFDPRRGGGLAVGGEVAYGLSDWLMLKARAGYSRHGLDADMMKKLTESTGQVLLGSVGVEYALDVLKLVPTLELGVGASYILEDGRDNAVDLLLQVGVGMDYLLTRRYTVGLGAQYHVLLTDPSRVPVYVFIGPRAAMSWE